MPPKTISRALLIWLAFVCATISAAQTAPPASTHYEPLTAGQRFQWFANNTVGPKSLLTGVFSAGYGTAVDSPQEYGTHWEGFGKRYRLRLSVVATGSAIEGSLGAAWGEDPRYFRQPELPFKSRVERVVKMTFLAQNRRGETVPAYARFIAIPTNNFLSNTWRPRSEANASHAIGRSVLGLLSRMAGNAFTEFMPDALRVVGRHKNNRP